MSYKLLYYEEAKQDIIEAKIWYRKQQAGLEMRFAVAIKDSILRLQNNPTAFAIRYKSIRIIHPAVFPYAIHFYLDEASKTVVIAAIIHNKRNRDIPDSRI